MRKKQNIISSQWNNTMKNDIFLENVDKFVENLFGKQILLWKVKLEVGNHFCKRRIKKRLHGILEGRCDRPPHSEPTSVFHQSLGLAKDPTLSRACSPLNVKSVTVLALFDFSIPRIWQSSVVNVSSFSFR